jgi:membrane-associated phospholipid phosphatase
MPLMFRVSEWVALGYFVYLAAVVLLVDAPSESKRCVLATILFAMAATVALALQTGAGASAARDWMPLANLVIGYWLPAQLVVRTNPRFERALLDLDARICGKDAMTRYAAKAPRFLIEYFELTYLFCYPIVPAGLVCLLVAGMRDRADMYWTTVLLAGFACYGLLPWLPARAPRAVETGPTADRSLVRRFNLAVLDQASVGLNTFPSGHAATSAAIALVLLASVPAAGAVFCVIALSIAVASVVGRYHYAADALSGVAVGAAAFEVARRLW